MRPIYIIFCLAVLLPMGDSNAPELPVALRWNPDTLTQVLPREFSGDPYLVEFLKIPYKWNTGTIEFPALGELRTQFMDNLNQAVKQRPHGYETDEWAEAKLRQFNTLIEKTARPQLKFDRQAVLSLTLAYSINLPLIRKRFKPQSLERELALPMYVLFLDSQEHALKEKHYFITSEDVSLTIFKWWTTIWPFCAPPLR